MTMMDKHDRTLGHLREEEAPSPVRLTIKRGWGWRDELRWKHLEFKTWYQKKYQAFEVWCDNWKTRHPFLHSGLAFLGAGLCLLCLGLLLVMMSSRYDPPV